MTTDICHALPTDDYPLPIPYPRPLPILSQVLLDTVEHSLPTPYPLLDTLYPLLDTLYPLLDTPYPLLDTPYPLLDTPYPLLDTVRYPSYTHSQLYNLYWLHVIPILSLPLYNRTSRLSTPCLFLAMQWVQTRNSTPSLLTIILV